MGPAAQETESIGFGNVLSTAFEVLIVLGCLGLLSRSRAMRPLHTGRTEVVVEVLALAVTVVTILGLYSAVGGSPFVPHAG